MKCDKAISLIHEYLDGDINEQSNLLLKQHLNQCSECSRHLDELRKTERLIGLDSIPTADFDLSEKILKNLPGPKRRKRWLNAAKRRPAWTAAAIFLLIFTISFLSFGDSDHELTIKGEHLDQIEIDGTRVIVPEGKIVNGDLIVENGSVEIDGTVNGNITVIDGSFHMASTAAVSGKINHINQWIDRLWFHVFEWFKN